MPFWRLLYFYFDKAKPSVRRRRKAEGLTKSKIGELPKDEPAVSSAFFKSEKLFNERRGGRHSIFKSLRP